MFLRFGIKLQHVIYFPTQAVVLIGIKKNMLHHLCRKSIVVPTPSRKQGVRGRGVHREHTLTNLVSFEVVKNLRGACVSSLKVSDAICDIQGSGISLSSLSTSGIVFFEKCVEKWGEKRKEPFRMSDGQRAFGFILGLSSARSELAAGIERLAA